MTVAEFYAKRNLGEAQFFDMAGGNGKTILLSSHIYWTDLIGLALLRLGYNVIFAPPWYAFYLNDHWYENFDKLFNEWVGIIRQHKVSCIIGGNSTAMVIHPKTGEPLHRAAGVPIIHYWWDEPRGAPPMSRRGVTLRQYVDLIKDDRTLNVIWDADVCEELQTYLGIDNSVHVPLGTERDLWIKPFVPMALRLKGVCFLGNCHHFGAEERATYEPELVDWATRLAAAKLGDLTQSVNQCITAGGAATALIPVDTTNEAAIAREFRRWEIFNVLLMDQNRVEVVKGLKKRLGNAFTLLGRKWDTVGLTAQAEHSGVPDANAFYSSHKASLNLFGGCVHSGMPLRPFDIASSNGLIFTHYNRELPDLFEPGKECVAFKTESEMHAQLDHILARPSEFDPIIKAGHRRMTEHHTWGHRLQQVLTAAEHHFGHPV